MARYPDAIWKPVDRFWTKVDRSDDCWLWTAAKTAGGYGVFSMEGQLRYAHRLVYEWLVGEIPDGLQIDHLCRVRHCVNPVHLEPVTNHENAQRGVRATKTRCGNGHPYDEANTYVDPARGWRRCRACGRDRDAGRREAKAVMQNA